VPLVFPQTRVRHADTYHRDGDGEQVPQPYQYGIHNDGRPETAVRQPQFLFPSISTRRDPLIQQRSAPLPLPPLLAVLTRKSRLFVILQSILGHYIVQLKVVTARHVGSVRRGLPVFTVFMWFCRVYSVGLGFRSPCLHGAVIQTSGRG
jgi:hypothetical protein